MTPFEEKIIGTVYCKRSGEKGKLGLPFVQPETQACHSSQSFWHIPTKNRFGGCNVLQINGVPIALSSPQAAILLQSAAVGTMITVVAVNAFYLLFSRGKKAKYCAKGRQLVFLTV
jgi:hypothetical protein